MLGLRDGGMEEWWQEGDWCGYKGQKDNRGILVRLELLSVMTVMVGIRRPMQTIILSWSLVHTERHTSVEGDLWKPE